MRILNLDGLYLADIFAKLGAQVLTLGHMAGCEIYLDKPLSLRGLLDILKSRGFNPDLIFWADSCQPPSVVGFETLPAATIGFSIDMYCNPWHAPWMAGFDLRLAAQKEYLDILARTDADNPDGAPNPAARAEWFPLFCDPRVDKDLNLDRGIPVSFVGTLKGAFNSGRLPFLKAFRERHPLEAMEGSYVEPFNRSRIVLNQSAAGELNFRLFQAAACGALVLTEDAPSLADLYEPGEEVLTYPRGDAEAAAAMAGKALAEMNVQAMAARARRKTLARHSNSVRARHVLKQAEELLASGAYKHRLNNLEKVQKSMAEGFRRLAVDPAIPLPLDHRDFYAGLADTVLAGHSS